MSRLRLQLESLHSEGHVLVPLDPLLGLERKNTDMLQQLFQYNGTVF